MRALVKRLIKMIPFKQPLFTLLRRFHVPPEAIYKHLYFTGTFSTPLDGKSLRLRHHGFEVENEIFWTGLCGGWEGVSMSLWIELCRNSRFILDVGANTGIYALAAKTVSPDARVCAFEPVSRVYEKLVENCELNGYSIECVRKAASNYDGTATIYDPETDHLYSVTVNRNLLSPETHARKVEVETVRLETYLDALGGGEPPQVDLIKLDVETHEPEVLEGLGMYLERFRPSMLIEILSDEAAGRVEKFLQGKDYLYFNIDDIGKPRRQEHLSKSDHFNFLVCSEAEARRLKVL